MAADRAQRPRPALPPALQQLASTESGREYHVMAGAAPAVIPVIVIPMIFHRRIMEGIASTGLKSWSPADRGLAGSRASRTGPGVRYGPPRVPARFRS
ncbi:hypothetical protein AB0M95_03290 [Sphaerisporangium sp. NPDC051017]|uniref:hypothetical protein n=1 Tax=Sphaerisporangium sp. NPDC051017 TaxID=3154636 RepID=UPI00341414AD